MAKTKRGKKKAAAKRAAKRKGSKRVANKTREAGKASSAGEVLDSLELDTRHSGAEPLLRKLAEGKASAEDVNTAIDNDSRLEPLRGVLTRIADGEKVSTEEIDDAVDSKNEPLRPFIEALNE